MAHVLKPLLLDLHLWIESQIRKGKFGNFSHAVEIALETLRDSEREGKK